MTISFKLSSRPNVQLLRDNSPTSYENLDWFVLRLHEKNAECPKVLIFTPNVNSTARLYRWLMTELDVKAFKDKERHYSNPLIDMYRRHSDEDWRVHVQEISTRPDSHIRVDVATVDLGLDVDIPHLRIVLHWGSRNLSWFTGRKWGGWVGMGNRWYPLSTPSDNSPTSYENLDWFVLRLHEKNAECPKVLIRRC